MKWYEKIQWGRLDEVVLFFVSCCLLVVLVFLNAKDCPVPEAAWTAVGILLGAVARTLFKNGGGTNGSNNEPTESAVVRHPGVDAGNQPG